MPDADGTSSDPNAALSFAEQVLHDISRASAIVLAALGDRLGLFRALADQGPATSTELAVRVGAGERYVREWLGGMVSAGYLAYDPASNQFSLPPSHVPALAQEAGPLFFGGTFQLLLGALRPLPELERACRDGGGVPFSAYGDDTWDGLERDNAGLYETALVRQWIPAMPAVRSLLERGADLADIGCGRGHVIRLLVRAFSASRFVGYDVFAPSVAYANARAAELGLSPRVRFEQLDASVQRVDSADLITTFQMVHDVTDPLRMLRAIRASLRPGGHYVCLDARVAERLEQRTEPIDLVRYGFSLLYCLPTALAAGDAGLGTLGLTESTMRQFCHEAGFGAFTVVPLEGGFHTLYDVVG